MRPTAARAEPGSGSIIIIVATDAPLLPHQCDRLAQRATMGLARMGSTANHSSGDIVLAFATGNRGLATTDEPGVAAPVTHEVRMNRQPDDAPVQGHRRGDRGGGRERPALRGDPDGPRRLTAHALDHDRLLDVLARYNRGPRAGGGT